MPLPGLLWSSARGAEDGMIGLKGQDGGLLQVMEVTRVGEGRLFASSTNLPLSFTRSDGTFLVTSLPS